MIVDRHRRDQYAELLRHFAAGRLTNDEYVDASDRCRASPDLVIREAWWSVWYSYDDLHEHRLTGDYKLSRDDRKIVARMILFLHSDLPYEWPVAPVFLRVILQLLTLGLWGLCCSVFESGDRNVWPFYRAEDLARAVARPRLLSGR